MQVHARALVSPKGRQRVVELVECGEWSVTAAAEAVGVSERRASEWVRRFRQGDGELLDRSSQPKRVPGKTPPDREHAILALRDLRLTAAEIAEALGMPHSTVSAVLKRCGRGRLPRLAADEPERRYERA